MFELSDQERTFSGDLSSAINLHEAALEQVEFCIFLDCSAAHARDSCYRLKRGRAAIIQNLKHLDLDVGKTERLDAEYATEFVPLFAHEEIAVARFAVHLNFFCTLNSRASVAASGAGDIFE